jgi:hypothetical protein
MSSSQVQLKASRSGEAFGVVFVVFLGHFSVDNVEGFCGMGALALMGQAVRHQ